MIPRGDLYNPVVRALKENGGAATVNEIHDKVRWDLISGSNVMSDTDLFTLSVISVIEDLERNGLVERIDEELYSLSD
jgi:hypothetical protein